MTLLLAVIGAFAQAFAGTWTCHSAPNQNVPWVITQSPGETWTSVRWGDQESATGGIAYVGYVESLHTWVYRDFHYDGAYADITGTNTGNQWRWTGPYYAGGRTLNGDIVWTLTSHDRIDREFRSLQNGKLTPGGRDFCVRVRAGVYPR